MMSRTALEATVVELVFKIKITLFESAGVLILGVQSAALKVDSNGTWPLSPNSENCFQVLRRK